MFGSSGWRESPNIGTLQHMQCALGRALPIFGSVDKCDGLGGERDAATNKAFSETF